MRTAEEIIEGLWPYQHPDNFDIFKKIMPSTYEAIIFAINTARFEAITLCSERASVKWDGTVDERCQDNYEVDKQSILQLINEVK